MREYCFNGIRRLTVCNLRNFGFRAGGSGNDG